MCNLNSSCLETSFLKNENFQSVVIATSTTVVVIALVAIASVAAAYGWLGSPARAFITSSLGPIPVWSLDLVGTIGTGVSVFGAVFCIARGLYYLSNKEDSSTAVRNIARAIDPQAAGLEEEKPQVVSKQLSPADQYPIPQWVRSKAGSIGDQHLRYYLKNQKCS